MSTSSTSSSSASSGYQLTSLGGSSTLQVTGLASGLDTNEIVSELMATKQAPLTALQNQEKGLEATDTQLTSVQSALETVADDARALLDPSLFADTQTVTSSNPSAISATTTGGGGAVVGGYQVSVSQLANSAQRTFSYAAPTSADTITIDGQAVSIAAGESSASLAQTINANSSLDVYAAATSSGTLVLSDRATGQQSGDYIDVADPGGALTEQTAAAYAGQDAEYTVGSTSGSSASNTVTGAIAGVTLNLQGVTTGGSPVTVDVSAPAPSTTAVQSAVQQFVTDYNSAITTIQSQLAQVPSSSDPTQGTLYDDQDLSSLLANMRTAMVQSVAGSDGTVSSMLDIGVSTGATTGSASPTTSSLLGDLTLNASTLTAALQSDPSGVQSMIAGWANGFSSLVGAEADPGGTISQRMSANANQVNDLGQQISDMQASLTAQQNQLVQQFAALEAALSQNQSESSWLTSQIAALPTA